MVNQEPRKRGAVPTRLLAAKDTSLTPGDPSNNAHTGKGGMITLIQWKKPKTIYKNLKRLNERFQGRFSHKDFYKVANSSRGPYAKACGDVVNFLLSPKVLEMKNEKTRRPGLINPLDYYIAKHSCFI